MLSNVYSGSTTKACKLMLTVVASVSVTLIFDYRFEVSRMASGCMGHTNSNLAEISRRKPKGSNGLTVGDTSKGSDGLAVGRCHSTKPIYTYEKKAHVIYEPDKAARLDFDLVHRKEIEEVKAKVPIYYHFLMLGNGYVSLTNYVAFKSALNSHPLAMVNVWTNTKLHGKYANELNGVHRFFHWPYQGTGKGVIRKVGRGDGTPLREPDHLFDYQRFVLMKTYPGIFLHSNVAVLKDPLHLRMSHSCTVDKWSNKATVGSVAILSTPGCSFIQSVLDQYLTSYNPKGNSSDSEALLTSWMNSGTQARVKMAPLVKTGESLTKELYEMNTPMEDFLEGSFMVSLDLEKHEKKVVQKGELNKDSFKDVKTTIGAIVRHAIRTV